VVSLSLVVAERPVQFQMCVCVFSFVVLVVFIFNKCAFVVACERLQKACALESASISARANTKIVSGSERKFLVVLAALFRERMLAAETHQKSSIK